MTVDIYKNDFTIIMGPSGAGKSTLLYLSLIHISLCIDKAALNAMNIVLHHELEPKGIFVGSVLVSGVIAPGDEKYDPALIAKEYWKMYTERNAFEVVY